MSKTGADLIADFIAAKCFPNVFLVTGGACAFIVDAIGRSKELKFTCFQHEQSAAMAADAIWRTSGKVGVTLATSGPGATNLITGIACSWFDSIPSLHITGQVNTNESKDFLNVNVRQAGFQETDIVQIVSSITKWNKKITSTDDLVDSLPKALHEATTGRMGPVLLDIPMNIQKSLISDEQYSRAFQNFDAPKQNKVNEQINLNVFFENSIRPLVLLGAGLGLSSKFDEAQEWCEVKGIPYVTSWGGLSYLKSASSHYQGSIGVYGSRHANFAIQSADKILVLGSRLDNRQRTGNPFGFAPYASILVVDIDGEELKKYSSQQNYQVLNLDLRNIDGLLQDCNQNLSNSAWLSILDESRVITKSGFEESVSGDGLNPYNAMIHIRKKMGHEPIVVSDCGANLCWVYQSWTPSEAILFTAGGNSPMGYSLPASIGAQIANPDKLVFCFIGDGGFQMNIQELQTIVNLKLPIKIVIQNNFGYGIIKQFQDAYFEGRHFATGEGYSLPDFGAISKAYGINYVVVENLQQIDQLQFDNGPMIIDMHLPHDALISPKTEMDRFIHDQFPYLDDQLSHRLQYKYPERPSKLNQISNPTV
jgi:acetolactate synthase I/II/III large subunit